MKIWFAFSFYCVLVASSLQLLPFLLSIDFGKDNSNDCCKSRAAMFELAIVLISGTCTLLWNTCSLY